MICVLSEEATSAAKSIVEETLLRQVARVNETVYHHARIGAVIVTTEPWTIDNGVLTPTLKVRRGQVEEKFNELAESLGRRAAESRQEFIEWV
jgi:long-chain acyl-CoA synthetase